jgi:hypothetical protein
MSLPLQGSGQPASDSLRVTSRNHKATSRRASHADAVSAGGAGAEWSHSPTRAGSSLVGSVPR